MRKIFLEKIKISSLSLILFSLFLFPFFFREVHAQDLSGRILLQVEAKGEAWYVNPLDKKRYYLGRPDDAFNLMRSMGLGISNADLSSFLKTSTPIRLKGRILLQVEDKGQAYYVNPVDNKLNYLGRPTDAFNLMRSVGLGISNQNLNLISIGGNLGSESIDQKNSTEQLITFSFKYNNQSYQIKQAFSDSLFKEYENSPKIYSYQGNQPVFNPRDSFYSLFLTAKQGDNSLERLITQLQEIAKENNFNNDETLEFILSFIQHIPYDKAKASLEQTSIKPYYPFETLYLNTGICSDKVFLGVSILRKLGYGAAILDFPEVNHSALGLACPIEYSIDNSGYCYVETTNYFPPGIIPTSISNGQADKGETMSNLFNRDGLGRLEIYQKSAGKIYQGIITTISKSNYLQKEQDELNQIKERLNIQEKNIKQQSSRLNDLKRELDDYLASRQFEKYNNLAGEYNNLGKNYTQLIADYYQEINAYNLSVNNLEKLFKDFFQY